MDWAYRRRRGLCWATPAFGRKWRGSGMRSLACRARTERELCNGSRQEEDTMRRWTALWMIACLAASTPIHAQEAPADQGTSAASSTMAPRTRAAVLLELQSEAPPGPASSLVASATRAASRLELQPASAPRQGRDKNRLYVGLAMVCLSPVFFLMAALHGADYPTTTETFAWGGLLLGVGGGVMIALADSTSPIGVRTGRPEEPTSFARPAKRRPCESCEGAADIRRTR